MFSPYLRFCARANLHVPACMYQFARILARFKEIASTAFWSESWYYAISLSPSPHQRLSMALEVASAVVRCHLRATHWDTWDTILAGRSAGQRGTADVPVKMGRGTPRDSAGQPAGQSAGHSPGPAWDSKCLGKNGPRDNVGHHRLPGRGTLRDSAGQQMY